MPPTFFYYKTTSRQGTRACALLTLEAQMPVCKSDLNLGLSIFLIPDVPESSDNIFFLKYSLFS